MLHRSGIDRSFVRRFRAIGIHWSTRLGGCRLDSAGTSPSEERTRHGSGTCSRHRQPDRLLRIHPHRPPPPMDPAAWRRERPRQIDAHRPLDRLRRPAMAGMVPRKRTLGADGVRPLRDPRPRMHDPPDSFNWHLWGRERDDASAHRTIRNTDNARIVEKRGDSDSNRPRKRSDRPDAGTPRSPNGHNRRLVSRNLVDSGCGDIGCDPP